MNLKRLLAIVFDVTSFMILLLTLLIIRWQNLHLAEVCKPYTEEYCYAYCFNQSINAINISASILKENINTNISLVFNQTGSVK